MTILSSLHCSLEYRYNGTSCFKFLLSWPLPLMIWNLELWNKQASSALPGFWQSIFSAPQETKLKHVYAFELHGCYRNEIRQCVPLQNELLLPEQCPWAESMWQCTVLCSSYSSSGCMVWVDHDLCNPCVLRRFYLFSIIWATMSTLCGSSFLFKLTNYFPEYYAIFPVVTWKVQLRQIHTNTCLAYLTGS